MGKYFSSGTHCGIVPPQDLVSDGNTLHVSFSSNGKVVDTGFTASWKAVDPTEGKTGGKWRKEIHGKSLSGLPSVCFSLFPVTHTSSMWRQLQQQPG